MTHDSQAGDPGDARYRFSVRFRIDPDDRDLTLAPNAFETTLSRRATPPGEDGWRFFQTHLWRGSLSNPDHYRSRVEEALGTTVESVEFRELRTDEEYLDALRSAVGEDLAAFNADSVDRALTNHLGSSIHVVDDG